MTIGGKHFMGSVILRVDTVDESRYIPYHELRSTGPTITQHYAVIEVQGEVPEDAEESFEEVVLEEALAKAMAKRQGDE